METKRIIRTKRLSRLILSLLLLSIAAVLPAQFSGGDGTEGSPYIISNAEQLNNVRDFASSHFRLRDDIDLDVAPFNEGEGWEPIGEGFHGFNGVFDGDGHTISGLFINRPETNRVGLFARVCGRAGPALVKNVRLIDVDITGNDEVGGLVGSMLEADPGVVNCGVSGRIRGGDEVGGLVGDALRSAVSDSFSDSHVTGVDDVGGLAGSFADTPIENSYSSGRVVGNDEVGGLVGSNLRSDIRNSYSVAGAEGNDQVGGLIGYSRDNNITHCYSAGRVSGEERAGGFVGNHLRATPRFCYWDVETSTMNESPIGEGRTTAEMTYPYAANTYQDWDFDELWVHDEAGTINNGYPYLYFHPLPEDGLDAPVVIIDIIEHEGDDAVRLRWEAIDDALSYRIYATDDMSQENWGEPLGVTEQTEYIADLEESMFFQVVASPEAP